MSVRIDVEGDDDALEDLWEWLNAERELCGNLRLESAPALPGTMGSGLEIVMAASALGLTVISTAVTSIQAWLDWRRSQPGTPTATVTFTAADGRKLEFPYEDPAQVAHVLATFSERLDSNDGPAA